LGKFEILLLLEFPTTYFAGQGFNQVLHIMGGGAFFKVGAQAHGKKSIESVCDLNWQL